MFGLRIKVSPVGFLRVTSSIYFVCAYTGVACVDLLTGVGGQLQRSDRNTSCGMLPRIRYLYRLSVFRIPWVYIMVFSIQHVRINLHLYLKQKYFVFLFYSNWLSIAEIAIHFILFLKLFLFIELWSTGKISVVDSIQSFEDNATKFVGYLKDLNGHQPKKI